jgi:hypothetical protein
MPGHEGHPLRPHAGQPGAPRSEAGTLPATDALLARSMSFAIGVLDPNLAPLGLRMRDDAGVARRQAERFRAAWLRDVA